MTTEQGSSPLTWRTHLRDKKKVETDIGIMFMMMNLSKYGAKRVSVK